MGGGNRRLGKGNRGQLLWGKGRQRKGGGDRRGADRGGDGDGEFNAEEVCRLLEKLPSLGTAEVVKPASRVMTRLSGRPFQDFIDNMPGHSQEKQGLQTALEGAFHCFLKKDRAKLRALVGPYGIDLPDEEGGGGGGGGRRGTARTGAKKRERGGGDGPGHKKGSGRSGRRQALVKESARFGKGSKQQTGANTIEVEWDNPQGDEDEDKEGATPKARGLSPVRGPAGRGRAMPAWMTKSEPKPPAIADIPAADEEKADEPRVDVSPPREQGNGRGRENSRSAWRKPGSKSEAPPSIPRHEDGDEEPVNRPPADDAKDADDLLSSFHNEREGASKGGRSSGKNGGKGGRSRSRKRKDGKGKGRSESGGGAQKDSNWGRNDDWNAQGGWNSKADTWNAASWNNSGGWDSAKSWNDRGVERDNDRRVERKHERDRGNDRRDDRAIERWVPPASPPRRNGDHDERNLRRDGVEPTCIEHGKERRWDLLVEDGNGHWRCRPGDECITIVASHLIGRSDKHLSIADIAPEVTKIPVRLTTNIGLEGKARSKVVPIEPRPKQAAFKSRSPRERDRSARSPYERDRRSRERDRRADSRQRAGRPSPRQRASSAPRERSPRHRDDSSTRSDRRAKQGKSRLAGSPGAPPPPPPPPPPARVSDEQQNQQQAQLTIQRHMQVCQQNAQASQEHHRQQVQHQQQQQQQQLLQQQHQQQHQQLQYPPQWPPTYMHPTAGSGGLHAGYVPQVIPPPGARPVPMPVAPPHSPPAMPVKVLPMMHAAQHAPAPGPPRIEPQAPLMIDAEDL